MRKLILLALILLLLLALAGCAGLSPDDLSRESGRQARQVVDQLLQQLGEFVAGFCGAALAPVSLVLLAVGRPSKRRR